MATKITAAKLEQAVKALQVVLECGDAEQFVNPEPLRDAVRVLVKARVRLWNNPGR